jgi:hypothetical protein
MSSQLVEGHQVDRGGDGDAALVRRLLHLAPGEG